MGFWGPFRRKDALGHLFRSWTSFLGEMGGGQWHSAPNDAPVLRFVCDLPKPSAPKSAENRGSADFGGGMLLCLCL